MAKDRHRCGAWVKVAGHFAKQLRGTPFGDIGGKEHQECKFSLPKKKSETNGVSYQSITR